MSYVNTSNSTLSQMDVYVMKSQSQQQGKMALSLLDSAVESAQQVSQSGGSLHAPAAHINIQQNAAGANPGDRLGENVNICV
ncbi:MAG: hypothetical protein IJ523_06285 [Succinivibrionaceae bacterium]|nr:hypothetical protein [Succinivibrionaceae bacterium]